MIEPVYQQEAYAGNPLHLGFIDAMGNTLTQMAQGDYAFRFIKNSDGSYRIRNEEKGWYLGASTRLTATGSRPP